MADTPERYRPWYCGTQYADWDERNCLRCALCGDLRSSECPIFIGIVDAFFGDGSVGEETARRCGYLKADGDLETAHNWDCPERVVVPQEPTDG